MTNDRKKLEAEILADIHARMRHDALVEAIKFCYARFQVHTEMAEAQTSDDMRAKFSQLAAESADCGIAIGQIMSKA